MTSEDIRQIEQAADAADRLLEFGADDVGQPLNADYWTGYRDALRMVVLRLSTSPGRQ